MMLVGRIRKEEGPFWSADVDAIGAYTQGDSRKDAAAMLVDLVQTMVGRPGFKATVSEIGPVEDERQAFAVHVTGTESALLAALVLRYQREIHKMSLADVATALGAKSRNAYAAYEQGRTEPTLSKYLELLKVVAPEMTLTVGPLSIEKRKAKEVGVMMDGKKRVSRAADRTRAPALHSKGAREP